MEPQEVKPEGRRPIGQVSVRAAHNVHKVDVCACSLQGNMEKAISRAEQLRRYHEDNNTLKLSERNPITDVDRLVKLLCDAG